MFEDFDQEARALYAKGALDCLTDLIEGTRPGEGPDIAKIGKLLRVVNAAVQAALPSGLPAHCNDLD
jgi:hypothetical protein